MRAIVTLPAVVAAGPLPGAAATVTVTIENMKFTPATVEVHVAMIQWVNNDFVAHTATASTRRASTHGARPQERTLR